jgi:hypothetical protein
MVHYPNGNVTISPGVSFGIYGYMGMPLGQLLDQQCGSRQRAPE